MRNESFTVAQPRIVGTVWLPDDEPLGVLLVHPATAVPERMYRHLAAYAAGRGLVTLTYDWCGTGGSGDERTSDRSMRDWIDTDAQAVTDWAAARFGGLPMVALGHSVGGHALALGAGRTQLRAFATVASHAGTTAAIPTLAERLRVGLVLGLLGPLSSRLLGYVPGRRLGLGEDMPGAAMLQWSRWSKLPRYFFDDPAMRAAERAAEVCLPVLATGFTDDLWATEQQIRVITDHLVNADVTVRMVSPEDAGGPVGHMGFFRPERAAQWEPVLDFLLAHVVDEHVLGEHRGAEHVAAEPRAEA